MYLRLLYSSRFIVTLAARMCSLHTLLLLYLNARVLTVDTDTSYLSWCLLYWWLQDMRLYTVWARMFWPIIVDWQLPPWYWSERDLGRKEKYECGDHRFGALFAACAYAFYVVDLAGVSGWFPHLVFIDTYVKRYALCYSTKRHALDAYDICGGIYRCFSWDIPKRSGCHFFAGRGLITETI